MTKFQLLVWLELSSAVIYHQFNNLGSGWAVETKTAIDDNSQLKQLFLQPCVRRLQTLSYRDDQPDPNRNDRTEQEQCLYLVEWTTTLMSKAKCERPDWSFKLMERLEKFITKGFEDICNTCIERYHTTQLLLERLVKSSFDSSERFFATQKNPLVQPCCMISSSHLFLLQVHFATEFFNPILLSGVVASSGQ
ncbi:hypothetical protein ACTXT7_004201 [Hymenolepis weldensis]